MNWIRVTAVLLITAIFNPLCCCLDLSAEPLEQASPSAAAHSCCTASTEAKSGLGKHSQEECPHSSEKDSQINEGALAQDSLQKPHQPLVYTLPALPVLAAAPQSQTPRDNTRIRALQEPSSQRSLAYCVYLI
ncbi:hypothetical protein IEN85_13990 [Pelagicoccus sp. NFK12]|uniref:Secreted protein n=1 Tax=Pelagicoccus enzymogenes TaxID=2773457 RepID=A0A927F8U1_9BACT|nr:hypothetical protein [Pelagicoccus enzymogenes]MBD5780608.1 hypothetical protein [Pelagicoccus enzymogenes]